jgi:hypothetical protein
MAAAPQQMTQQQMFQMNNSARAAVLGSSVNMTQQIYNTTLSGTVPGQVINVPLRNVGLIKRLWVEVSFTLAQSASETYTRTALGPANIFSNVTYTDLSNQQRINTTSAHLFMLSTLKRQFAFGAAFTNDSPCSMGSNVSVIVAPATVSTVQTIRMFFEVPLAYTDLDLRGSVYANVVNATQQLSLTVNPALLGASTADPGTSVYLSSGAATGTIGAFTVTVYQNYLDQLPMGQNGPILPLVDLSTAYLLNNTIATAIVANQDFPVSFANFRNFNSIIVGFDNAKTYNAGSDVNKWKLQSANYTNIEEMDPYLVCLKNRNRVADDFPAGWYAFDYRDRPISTQQYGNMQLVLNASSVTSGASLFLYWEAFAFINQVQQAGSLFAS